MIIRIKNIRLSLVELSKLPGQGHKVVLTDVIWIVNEPRYMCTKNEHWILYKSKVTSKTNRQTDKQNNMAQLSSFCGITMCFVKHHVPNLTHLKSQRHASGQKVNNHSVTGSHRQKHMYHVCTYHILKVTGKVKFADIQKDRPKPILLLYPKSFDSRT